MKELTRAEKTIAKMVQRDVFAQEIRGLKNEQEVQRKGKLRALDPILYKEGLIRVGGRLRDADISEDHKHQIILPSKHFVTSFLKNEHIRLHHCPPSSAIERCTTQILAIEWSKRSE